MAGVTTIIYVENFGKYIQSQDVILQESGLSGTNSEILLGFHSCVIILAGLKLILNYIRARTETPEEMKQFEPFYGDQIFGLPLEKWIIFATLATGITNAALNIHLLENYPNISGLLLSTDTNQNVTLSGPYGNGLFAVSTVACTLTGLSMLVDRQEVLSALPPFFVDFFRLIGQILFMPV
jgi:hypothetical protein